jgi:cell division protein FtsZ
MDEIMEITDYIQDAAGQSAEVIWGYAIDENLTEEVCVTVIATGFEAHEITTSAEPVAPEKIIHKLGDEAKEVTKAVETPVLLNTPEEEPQTNLFSESEPKVDDVVETEDIEEEVGAEEIKAETAEEKEKIIHNLDDNPVETVDEDILPEAEANEEISATTSDTQSIEENKKKAREAFLERQNQVKRTLNDVKMKLRLPGRILDIENEPAYKRRNVNLDDVSHSSESSVSHFSINEELDEDGERKIELRDDNPFLHDNVD